MKRIIIVLFLAIVFSFNGCIPYGKTLEKGPVQERVIPFKARDHFLRGLYHQQEGRYNEALVEYYQALHFDSTSATIYRTIGENYMRLGHYESAEIMLKKALNLDHRNPYTLNLLAESSLRMGKDDQAIQYYEKLLKITPYDNDARELLILLYEKQGKDLDVARHNRILMQLYGKNKDMLFKMVQIYLKNKQYDLAAKNCRSILKLDSTESRAYYFLGLMAEQKQYADSAIIYYKLALKFKPIFPQALDRITFLYRTQKNWHDIIRLYKRVLQKDSTYIPGKILLAESYFYLQQYDSARARLLPLVGQPDIPSGVYELLGRIEVESKNYNSAKEHFKKAVKLNEKNKFAWLFLAFTYTDMDSFAQAEKIYQKTLKLFPGDVTIWTFYGNLLQNQKKYEQSIDAFNKALKIDSTNESALSGLAILYENLKMFSKCDSIYEIALQRLPNSALLLNNYSYSLTERDKDLQRALEMAKKAIQLRPNNAAYLDTYGWVLYKLKNYPEAEKYIKKSIELRDDSDVVLEHLGDVYKAMGNLEQAVFYWKKALELKPENERLRKKIEEIAK
ncbi:MAG: tetratricopeptide repeat protein [Calditrichaeota bacterium]|nr:tetratricopeptide repeat protein [Calditrichota bacterium]